MCNEVATVNLMANLPDEQPQRRREYSGPFTTLGIALVVILIVGFVFWFFELRTGGGSNNIKADNFGVIEQEGDFDSESQPAVASLGRLAPNFRLPNAHGEVIKLSDLRGQYVLLNFWASWCGPCRAEVRDLSELSERFPEVLTVLGINQQEVSEIVIAFKSQFSVSYPLLLDFYGQVSSTYAISTGLPVSLLIDQKGVIREIYWGALSEEQYEHLILTYLL